MKQAPPFLKKGNTIGICCPSGFLEKGKVNQAIELFKQNGWNTVLGKTMESSSDNYFSGTDLERLQDLQNMLDDPNIHCIVFGRGGYGMSRILDRLNWEKFLKAPKWICGYSDITLLHCHLNTQLNFQSIHSPMAKNLIEQETEPFFINQFLDTLQGKKILFETPNVLPQFSNMGSTTSEVVGGNLSLVAHSIGSKSEINTKDKILFLEDVDEYQYNIDRLFLQLVRANKIQNTSALIFGGFTNIKNTQRPFGKNLYEMIQEHLKALNIPIVFDFPIGHQAQNLSIKTGATYTLNVDNKISLCEI